MKSWRTTLFGAIGICAGAIVAADFGPMVTKLAGCLASMASGIGLLFARDQRASRLERNGGVPIKMKLPPFSLFLLLLGALPAGAQDARPVLGTLEKDPKGPIFYVSTVQLPGEWLLWEWADTLGPDAVWHTLAVREPLPPESAPEVVFANAPGDWRAPDGQRRLFVRVTGSMALPPL